MMISKEPIPKPVESIIKKKIVFDYPPPKKFHHQRIPSSILLGKTSCYIPGNKLKLLVDVINAGVL